MIRKMQQNHLAFMLLCVRLALVMDSLLCASLVMVPPTYSHTTMYYYTCMYVHSMFRIKLQFSWIHVGVCMYHMGYGPTNSSVVIIINSQSQKFTSSVTIITLKKKVGTTCAFHVVCVLLLWVCV